MINLYDIAYWTGLGLASPYWLVKPRARRKVLSALSQRMGHVAPRGGEAPAVMIHAVSLGETNAARGLVQQLRAQRPDLQLVITSTTETGFARATELYGPHSRPPEPRNHAPGLLDPEPERPFTVMRFPLDFTPAVSRLLDNLRPAVVVLMELEIWPNFLLQCEQRGIPVIVANGRVTEPSYQKYRLLGPVVQRMFARLAAACVQEEVYARRFSALGTPPDRISVVGNVKFDTATVGSRVAGDDTLAGALHLRPGALLGSAPGAERVWVCGSTGPGEEKIILGLYRQLLGRFTRLRLVLVPRKPERFDEVAQQIADNGFDVVRRSQTVPDTTREQLMAFLGGAPPPTGEGVARNSTLLPPVILGDTMGELRKFYALADVVFVGRTLVDLGPKNHGSDMIEPAALARPVITGPFTGNFADVMSCFRAAGAMVEVSSAEQLLDAVAMILSTPVRATELARRAQEVVVSQRGATARHMEVIRQHLPPPAEGQSTLSA